MSILFSFAGICVPVIVVFKNGPNTPLIEQKKVQIPTTTTVGELIDILRKRLRLSPDESLFVYVMQSFCPSPLQDIGTLNECYGSNGKLILHYCKSEVWG